MERARSHVWLSRYSPPAAWKEVRRDASFVYFDDGRDERAPGAAGAGDVPKLPCSSCGKGVGPGTPLQQIYEDLAGG